MATMITHGKKPRQAEISAEEIFNHGVKLAQQGHFAEAIKQFEAFLEADPGNLAGLRNLGVIRTQLGDFEGAEQCYLEVIRRDPQDKTLVKDLNTVYTMGLQRAFATTNNEDALKYAGKAVGLNPANIDARINYTERQFWSLEPARLEHFARNLSVDDIGKTLLVACMPKSGSTWLSNVLCQITGYSRTYFSYAFMQQEQELYLPNVIEMATENTVVQQHCRATAANVQILQAFGITPIVLVRNIFDIVVSLFDFHRSGAVYNTFFYKDLPSLDEPTQLDLIIDNMLPWYFQFYVSWARAEEEGRLPILWVGYEEMMAEKAATLVRITEFYGIDRTVDQIRVVLEQLDEKKEDNRFNKGVAGRGEKTLSAEQRDRIRRFGTYYPSVDFSRIGL